jgi:hypothetical protein
MQSAFLVVVYISTIIPEDIYTVFYFYCILVFIIIIFVVIYLVIKNHYTSHLLTHLLLKLTKFDFIKLPKISGVDFS